MNTKSFLITNASHLYSRCRACAVERVNSLKTEDTRSQSHGCHGYGKKVNETTSYNQQCEHETIVIIYLFYSFFRTPNFNFQKAHIHIRIVGRMAALCSRFSFSFSMVLINIYNVSVSFTQLTCQTLSTWFRLFVCCCLVSCGVHDGWRESNKGKKGFVVIRNEILINENGVNDSMGGNEEESWVDFHAQRNVPGEEKTQNVRQVREKFWENYNSQ